MSNATRKIVDSIQNASKKKTSAYDTSAVVRRVEGNTAWVHIPGGVDETPVQMTSNAKAGDQVQVRVSGGKAWMYGNATSPPTDDTTAVKATMLATDANALAESASKAATQAWGFAEDAKSAAATAETHADEAKASAATAETHADEAKASAENASGYAARALGNLSTVQSVTETLNWITQHGTMTLTSDSALDPSHVYFVRDADGDYHVGSYYYSVVTEPDVADIATYYELSIDESLNNYVATHLAVDGEGLWIIPDAGGNKVLIATGQGSTYTSAGTYIVGGNAVLASFTADGITVGIDNGTQSYLYEDYHSLKMIDREGNVYFHISDLRNNEGNIVESFEIDGSGTNTFDLSYTLVQVVEVWLDDTLLTENTDYWIHNYNSIALVNVPATGILKAVYTTSVEEETLAKAFTFGTRKASGIGPFSSASGIDNIASGYNAHAEGELTVALGAHAHTEGWGTYAEASCAHAEGMQTVARGNGAHTEGFRTEARGDNAHAEGWGSLAKGGNSHAQNSHTIAAKANQTVIGKYNIEDTATASADQMAFIIGNGASDNARSNAFTVDWNGNVNIPAGAEYQVDGVPFGGAFIAEYGVTTFSDLLDAVAAEKPIIVKETDYYVSVTVDTYFLNSGLVMYGVYNAYQTPRLVVYELDSGDTWSMSVINLQEKLISGGNIKTINGSSVLGSGDISIPAGETLEDISSKFTFGGAWTSIVKNAWKYGKLVFFHLEASVGSYQANYGYTIATIASGYRPSLMAVCHAYTTDGSYNPKAVVSARVQTNGSIIVSSQNTTGAYFFVSGFYVLP